MYTTTAGLHPAESFPIDVHVEPALEDRRRLTTLFRPLLAIPHLILVGGPISAVAWWSWQSEPGRHEWGAGGGLLGAVAFLCAVIAWFAILFTGRHPRGLWDLAAFYLRWRVRVVAYAALLRDEYPPFGDGDYPATMNVEQPVGDRNKLTVAFRLLLAIPHLVVLSVLGVLWFVTTIVAWMSILATGRYPEVLYRFGVGMLRWNTRVEAYALLLVDDYPPFSLDF